MTLRLSRVQSNAARVMAERQLGGFPRRLQLLELVQVDTPATSGQRVQAQANEREISGVRRNDRVNVAEIRGRTCELASLPILERVQVDRRGGGGAGLIAEDQVLAVRRPREPERPGAAAPRRSFRSCLEQLLLATAERRQNRKSRAFRPGHGRTRSVVRRATTPVHSRPRHVRQAQLKAAVDRSDVDVEVVSASPSHANATNLPSGEIAGSSSNPGKLVMGRGLAATGAASFRRQTDPESRADDRKREGREHDMPQADSSGPGGLGTRGGRSLGARRHVCRCAAAEPLTRRTSTGAMNRYPRRGSVSI